MSSRLRVIRKQRSSRLILATAIGTVIGLGSGLAVTSAPIELAQTTTGSIAAATAMTVSGTVFHDFTVDGLRQQTPAATFDEPGLGGVTVRAFDVSGALVDTATTSADGTYTLQVTSAATTDVRIEFTTPTGFRPSVVGADAGPSIQFTTAGTSGVNFAVQIPTEFCQANPRVFVACYYPGSIGRNGTLGVLMSNDWLMRGNVGGAGFTPATPVLTKAQAGSVWGVATQRQTGLVFTSAVVRRHAALGPQGIGGLYVAAAGTPGLVASFDLAAAPHGLTLKAPGSDYSDSARGMTNNTSDLSLDIVGFNGLGTEGIGGLEISPDGRHLYLTNLYERNVVRFELTGTAETPALGPPSVFQLPALCAETERPWALQALDDGSVLVGVNCITLRTYGAPLPRACTLADCSNVATTHAQVLETPEPGVIVRLEPDGADGAGSWTELSRVSFDYPRETDTCRPALDGNSGLGRNTVTGIDESGITGIRCRAARWHPWTNDWSNFKNAAWREHSATDSMHFWPQPIIADIEFLRDGSLAVGIADRFSMQVGSNNRPPTNTTDPLIYTWVHGDLRLICLTDDGYVEEQNGRCGTTTYASAPTPDRIEFFHDKHIHNEPILGGLLLHPNRSDNTLVATVMDPVTINSSGLLWFSVDDGTKVLPGADIVPREDTNPPATFKKASGMGDVELLCDFAPVSLGDRVWLDVDRDGLQDPGEPGIAGVTVRLYDADENLVAARLTDAQGRYLFTTAADGLLPGVAYTVRLDDPADYVTGGPLEHLQLTTANQGSSAESMSDEVDSDAIVVGAGPFGVGAFPEIAVVPLEAGDNVYSYDVGFTTPAPAPLVGDLGFVTPAVSVGDFVWSDLNRNGIQDPGEPGIEGVSLTIQRVNPTTGTLEDALDILGAVVGPTLTNRDGFYSFDLLAAGYQYVVSVSSPAGMTPAPAQVGDPTTDSSTGSATSRLLTQNGDRDPTLDFGFVMDVGSVAGNVWWDTDRDAHRSGSEVVLVGVEVMLLHPDGSPVFDVFGRLVTTTFTDTNGNYMFDNLWPGSYIVVIVTPPATDPTNVPGAHLPSRVLLEVVLGPGQRLSGFDVGVALSQLPATGSGRTLPMLAWWLVMFGIFAEAARRQRMITDTGRTVSNPASKPV